MVVQISFLYFIIIFFFLSSNPNTQLKSKYITFFFNKQNFIKNQIPAQDEQRPDRKYKLKASYIGRTPENKTSIKTPL